MEASTKKKIAFAQKINGSREPVAACSDCGLPVFAERSEVPCFSCGSFQLAADSVVIQMATEVQVHAEDVRYFTGVYYRYMAKRANKVPDSTVENALSENVSAAYLAMQRVRCQIVERANRHTVSLAEVGIG